VCASEWFGGVNLTEWARLQGVHPQTAYRWFRQGSLPVPAVRVETEVGSGMNGARPKVRRLLADPLVATVVVEHRDRLVPMNTQLVEAAVVGARAWAGGR
jgi:putative resolvase